MKKIIYLLFVIPCSLFGQHTNSWEAEKIEIIDGEESSILMGAAPIFNHNWHTLPQAIFWKKIMLLPPDSCFINVMSTRVILEKQSIHDWKAQTEAEKTIYKDSLKKAYNLAVDETIFVTTGKNDFYKFDEVYASLSKGVAAFEKEGVDPWYAQSILLIESPGQLKKSISGAYGAFQLMPGVARAQGLTVNKHVDERKDFDKSAMASARLIQRICIPETKKILDAHQITYNESDLWFRLMVLHVYHAGASNVAAVIDKINPSEGNQELITQMWQTKAAHFGNNSQNYSQLALASQLILHEMIYSKNVYIYECALADINE
jgi:hypothetical protein